MKNLIQALKISTKITIGLILVISCIFAMFYLIANYFWLGIFVLAVLVFCLFTFVAWVEIEEAERSSANFEKRLKAELDWHNRKNGG